MPSTRRILRCLPRARRRTALCRLIEDHLQRTARNSCDFAAVARAAAQSATAKREFVNAKRGRRSVNDQSRKRAQHRVADGRTSSSRARASWRPAAQERRRPAKPIGASRRKRFRPCAKAGLMRVCTPKRYGGWEMNTRAMLDVSSAVAEGDGGAAWVVNLNNVCCWLTSLFPVKAQDEVFGADPGCVRLRRAQSDRDGEESGGRISRHRPVALQFGRLARAVGGARHADCQRCR